MDEDKRTPGVTGHKERVIVPTVDLLSDVAMPILGLGTFQNEESDRQNMKSILNTAMDCGYRHIDTATLYQNESMIGDCLHEWLATGKRKREDLFVTTKLPMIGNRPEDVHKFLKLSLQKLQLSYVDLYLIHMPVGMIGEDENDVRPKDKQGQVNLDLQTNLEAIYSAMEDQVDKGLTRTIGLSNFNSQQIERIIKASRIRPAVLQVELHAYHQQKELREICKRHNIHVCAFGPLGAPYKTRGSTEATSSHPILLEHPIVTSLAMKYNKAPAQILLRFLIQLGVIVIPGAPTPEMILQNIQVFDFELNSADTEKLERVDRGRDGKMFDFKLYNGISRHPEYPFRISY